MLQAKELRYLIKTAESVASSHQAMTDVHLRIYELYIDALVLVTVRTVSDSLHTVLTVQKHRNQ